MKTKTRPNRWWDEKWNEIKKLIAEQQADEIKARQAPPAKKPIRRKVR